MNNVAPTNDPATILSRIAKAMGLSAKASASNVENVVDLWMRNLTRIGRAAGASDLTDPVAVADAVENLKIQPNGVFRKSPEGLALVKIAEDYERKAALLREISREII
jgi:hypothetical protein